MKPVKADPVGEVAVVVPGTPRGSPLILAGRCSSQMSPLICYLAVGAAGMLLPSMIEPEVGSWWLSWVLEAVPDPAAGTIRYGRR